MGKLNFMRELTHDTFDEAIDRSGFMLVDFYGSNCAACKTIEPILEQVESDCNGIRFYKAHVERVGQHAQRANIRGLPSLVLYKDGKVIDMRVGVMSRMELLKFVTK